MPAITGSSGSSTMRLTGVPGLLASKGFAASGKQPFCSTLSVRQYGDSRDCLYVNLNDFYFSKRRIFSFADEFYKRGRKGAGA